MRQSSFGWLCTAASLPRSFAIPLALFLTLVWSSGWASQRGDVVQKFAVGIDVDTAVDGEKVQFSRVYLCYEMILGRSADGSLISEWRTDVRNIYQQLEDGEVVFMQVPSMCEEIAASKEVRTGSYLPVMGLLDRIEKPTQIELYGSIEGFKNAAFSRIDPPVLSLKRLSDDIVPEPDPRLDWIINRNSCHGGIVNPEALFAGYFLVSIPEEVWSDWPHRFVQFYKGQTASQRIEQEQLRDQFQLGVGASFKRTGGAATYDMGGFDQGLQRTSGEKSIYDYFVPLEIIEGEFVPSYKKRGILYYKSIGKDKKKVSANFYGVNIRVREFSLENKKPHFWRVFLADANTVNFLSSITQCY